VCPAVFIVSEGDAADLVQDSLGCFNYEGSLYDDEYPVYINENGLFLTPDYISNPVFGMTRWIVGDIPLAENGTVRNINHDDTFCPYDMHDGWEFYDADTQEWKEDASLQVLCVKPHVGQD